MKTKAAWFVGRPQGETRPGGRMMKTRAAVLRKAGEPWEVTELDLDEPKANEVLVRMEAAGLCHSDEHIRARGTARLPLVGGHEGAGVVAATGPGVTRVKVGDHVSCSYIPVCGKCRYCSTGRQNLCDAGSGPRSAACRTRPSGSTPAARTSAACASSARSRGGRCSRSGPASRS